MAALEPLLTGPSIPARIGVAFLSLALAWLLYVPVHELMHVAGCVATGGIVNEVRLASLYGGTFLSRVFPFVTAVDSGYAGRLTGFDTNGSDLCYLATDAAPYLLTILIGVPLLRSIGARPAGSAAWLFGPAVVLASAPFLSLTGDYFEMGTVLTTAVPWWRDYRLLRSDDLFRMVGQTVRHEINPGLVDLLIVILSLALAFVMASWTYRAGARWAAMVRRRQES